MSTRCLSVDVDFLALKGDTDYKCPRGVKMARSRLNTLPALIALTGAAQPEWCFAYSI